jgi:hypothetical protein
VRIVVRVLALLVTIRALPTRTRLTMLLPTAILPAIRATLIATFAPGRGRDDFHDLQTVTLFGPAGSSLKTMRVEVSEPEVVGRKRMGSAIGAPGATVNVRSALRDAAVVQTEDTHDHTVQILGDVYETTAPTVALGSTASPSAGSDLMLVVVQVDCEGVRELRYCRRPRRFGAPR